MVGSVPELIKSLVSDKEIDQNTLLKFRSICIGLKLTEKMNATLENPEIEAQDISLLL